MVGQLLLGLSIMVGIHEWGHLIAAKAFGMRVEKYYIGFPPKVIGRKWGETEYALGAIPLGGFVKISGMIDESLDTKNLKKEPEPWEFRAKPAWQRLIVMLGGIIMNVITGIIVFIVITFNNGIQYLPKEELNKHGIAAGALGEQMGFKDGDKVLKINGQDYEKFRDLIAPSLLVDSDVYFTVLRNGEEVRIDMPNDLIEKLSDKSNRNQVISPRMPFEVGKVQSKTAKKAGLQAGDRFIAIDGQHIRYFDEIQEILDAKKGKEVSAVIERSGEQKNLTLSVNEEGHIGFIPAMPEVENMYVREDLSFGRSVVKGTATAFNIVWLNIKGFQKIFAGDVSVQKSLSGPVRIATMFGGTWDWANFWNLIGLLSMVLAFMNLLPIPALDGGHVAFLSWEIISGRKPGDKFMENAQKVGMVLLLALMAFVIFNDTFQLLFG